ncbi:hypothetical protein MMC14_002188 [Varicellaria rhodocarpa]|nr:hypothetical protein [Varicellaria rhodocarpa]
MSSITQTRSHSGHSHSHHHDNTYLTSTNKKDAGVKVTRLGLYVNLGMAISKGIGGYYFNSQALVADAFHALTDLVSDFMTLATISVALKPPTSKYPNGFGKVESFGSLMVSGLLLAGGVMMGQHACSALYYQFFAEAAAAVGSHDHGIMGHSHSHDAAHLIPNINAAWLAAGSIIVKEYLYRKTMKVAVERKSSVLASNAVHHRVDSLTSIVALLAIGGSHVFSGATWLDPVGGLIVSLMVIRAGFGNTVSAVYELVDTNIDDEITQSVRKATAKVLSETTFNTTEGSFLGSEAEVRDIQGTKAGQNFLVDVELAVPGEWSIYQTRQVEGVVRERVGSKVRGVRRVRVKFVAKELEQSDFTEEFIGADVSPRSSPEPESDDNHHHHDDENPSANGNGKARKGL